MSLPSEAIFALPEKGVAPFEFRLLAREDVEALGNEAGLANGSNGHGNARPAGTGRDCAVLEMELREAVDAARLEGIQQGEREGRRAARSEIEVETRAAVAQERARLTDALEQFRGARERYFVDVEQEVVRLALAIAARVLHREAQIDPLLLTGAVRVAFEKMADRTGVVLRVAEMDVEAWARAFATTEASERPRVAGDARLERGECALETKMGTVELGVRVQLEEIEKGFFDLLNHRPVK